MATESTLQGELAPARSRTSIRGRLFNTKTAIILGQIYRGQQVRRRLSAQRFENSSGATHSRIALPESVAYIRQVFADYMIYGALTPMQLRGMRVLELGPGDNLGVGLLFLAHGAEQVVALDKFYSQRDDAHQREIYRALRKGLSGEPRRRFDEALDLSHGVAFNPNRLRYLFGHGVEEAPSVLGKAAFDLVVSRAVLEEVFEIDEAFAAMDALLKPGGWMLHKIDLRDYGLFSRRGMHPLTFLTIPDFVYDLMARDVGCPNRRLVDYYREKLAQMGYNALFRVTHLVGRRLELTPHLREPAKNVDYTDETLAMIAAIRPQLLGRFRALSDADLMVAGIFLAARKTE